MAFDSVSSNGSSRDEFASTMRPAVYRLITGSLFGRGQPSRALPQFAPQVFEFGFDPAEAVRSCRWLLGHARRTFGRLFFGQFSAPSLGVRKACFQRK